MDECPSELELPGFRFHPTEEELLSFYLRSVISGQNVDDTIGFLNIYNHDPKDLPGLARIGEREWYFFVQRDRNIGRGGRPNRITGKGYWKATGSDRKILSSSNPKKILLGFRKTLVFYGGRAPHGAKTDWVMNEYRLPGSCSGHKDIVVCKIYRKATSLKELEYRAAAMDGSLEAPAMLVGETSPGRSGGASPREDLPELQLPGFDMDYYWNQESLWAHFMNPTFLPY